jgi:hypothetical protein
MDTSAVRELIRQLLADSRLPKHAANRICASFGNGTSCEICGRATQPTGVMYELRFGGRDELKSIILHAECFDIYEQERAGAALESACVP